MVTSLKDPVDPWWHVDRVNEASVHSGIPLYISMYPIYLDTALPALGLEEEGIWGKSCS